MSDNVIQFPGTHECECEPPSPELIEAVVKIQQFFAQGCDAHGEIRMVIDDRIVIIPAHNADLLWDEEDFPEGA